MTETPLDTSRKPWGSMARGHWMNHGHQLTGTLITTDGVTRLHRTCCRPVMPYLEDVLSPLPAARRTRKANL